MDTNKYKSAIASTINKLLVNDKEHEHKTEESKSRTLDVGGFLFELKKEIVNLKIPIYDIKKSNYRENVIVLELPFCKSCEILIDSVEFGETNKQVTLFIDKKPVRRIKLENFEPKYMAKVAMALVDYFKRYLLLKNKFDS